MFEFKAMRDDVIIKPLTPEKRKSGLFVPERAEKETSGFYGEVVSIGHLNKMGLSVGDTILYSPHEGKKCGEYLSMGARHLLAKVDI